MNTNQKINRELLSKQIEIALKISSYAHTLCLCIFLLLSFLLDFDGVLPYLFLIYYIISQSNNLLYRLHKNILIVSITFFASSFISTLLISLYSGGLHSPFLGVIIVAIMGSFISGLKHGRFFLSIGFLGFVILFLNDVFGWIPDQTYSEIQERYFAILSYLFIFIIAGSAGLIIAKTSFKGFQAKKELEKKTVEIEKQKETLAIKNEEITASISYAKRIQEAIMPGMGAIQKAIGNGFVIYLPKDIVAGDFYWMERLGDTVFFAAADCTGHGVPGAMVSVVCSNALSKSLLEEKIEDPGKLLDRTREHVINRLGKSGEVVSDGMDISLCALNVKTKSLKWAGANNPIWILKSGSNEIIETKADKQPIGTYSHAKPFTSHAIELATGDCIYIFTDGYQDQFGGPKGKKFKARNLKNLILSSRDRSMEDQKKVLTDSFRQWQGGQDQVDDVCVIGLSV